MAVNSNLFYSLEEIKKNSEKFQNEIKKVFDLAIQEKISSEELKKTIKKLNLKDQDFLRLIESMMFQAVREYAILQYIVMEKTNNFTSMGEQRVSISFCRNILNIPGNREVTQFDADRFRRIVDQEAEKYKSMSTDTLVKKKKDPYLNFGFASYSIAEWKHINNILTALDSDKELLFTYHKDTPSIFFMSCERKNIGEMVFALVKKEYVRTPENVLSLAATQGDDFVRVRQESCEVIFFNKWQKFFDQSKIEFKRALNHPNSAIREGIKRKALQLYNVSTSAEVEKIRKVFIEEMIDGIIWHEIGHKVGQGKDFLTAEEDAIGAALGRGDTFVRAMTEALADWAPVKGKMQGAISRFCEIAKKDKPKALRLCYVYLSDNWFIDEEEEFMKYQNDILTALLLAYIKSDGDINFDQLEKDVPKIHAFLIKQYLKAIEEMKKLYGKVQYEVGIHMLSFENIKKETFKLYKDAEMKKSEEELLGSTHFWTNIMGYAKKFGKNFNVEFEDFLNNGGNEVLTAILKIVSKNNPDAYKGSLREYMYARFKELGILTEPKKVEYEVALNDACAKVKMPEKVAQKVKEKFKEIFDGKNYDISISYEGKPDPFIVVVQEMMLKTGLGDIKAGMLLGELYDADDPIEKRKEYIKNELEGIRDQIESEMYLEVEKLKVNKKMNIKPMVEELIGAVDFLNGKKLKDSIKEIVFEDIKNDALFEVFVPLKRGFMDWNTSQAVWRINQDLRPEEFTMQWTIDKEFLELLVGAY